MAPAGSAETAWNTGIIGATRLNTVAVPSTVIATQRRMSGSRWAASRQAWRSGGIDSSPRTVRLCTSCNSASLVWKVKYSVCTATPARCAIASIVVARKPCSQNRS